MRVLLDSRISNHTNTHLPQTTSLLQKASLLVYDPTMHAHAIINALVLSATLTHAAAIPAPLAASAPLQRRNGCYQSALLPGYLKFADLHGSSKKTDNAEVSLDITTTCNMAAGRVLKPGEVWTHCSEWAWETSSDCEGDCIASCPPRSTFPGTTSLADQLGGALCIASCPSQCKGKGTEVKTGTNRIDWAVKNEGSADATIDAQACKDALNWEIGGCDSGSEQSKGGFWYRIDPNEGKCGA
jgi:hypothetical protein